MKKRYAFLFPLTTPQGARIEWSSETWENIPNRANFPRDKEYIEDFREGNHPGSFIKLSTGEFVFQIA